MRMTHRVAHGDVDSFPLFAVGSPTMSIRIEYHPPPRRRAVRRERSSLPVVLAIAVAVVGTHFLFWMVGLIP